MNTRNSDFLTAKFDGNFDEYEIAKSKQMQGYYIITREQSGISELIGGDVKTLSFKDCDKSIADIEKIIQNKQLTQMLKSELLMKSTGIDESVSKQEIDELNKIRPKKQEIQADNTPISHSINEEIIKPKAKKSAKKGFEILDEPEQKPKRAKSKGFEILEAEDKNTKKSAFEIVEENDEIQNLAKDTLQNQSLQDKQKSIQTATINKQSILDEEVNSELVSDFARRMGADNAKRIKSVDNANPDDFDALFADGVETNSQNENKISYTSSANLKTQNKQEQDTTKGIPFGADVFLKDERINEIVVHIGGFDELNDSFHFGLVPSNTDYKYSIAKSEFKARFITDIGVQMAKDFISTFSFKTTRERPKRIEIFINSGVLPVFSAALFA